MLGGVRLELECGAIGGDRLIEPASLHEVVAEIRVGLGIVRLESHGPLIAGDRLLDLLLLPEHDTQVEGDLGVVRPEAQGLAQMASASSSRPCSWRTSPGFCLGEVRLEANGLPEAGHGLVQLTLLPQGIAQVIVCQGEVRLDGEGPPEAGHRFGQPPLVDQHDAQDIMRIGEIGLEPHRCIR